MLSRLTIQNVVIIEKLVIEFQAGLCALTGETGAGKSILLDSLGLALGKRADAGLVRSGAKTAIVSAEFEMAQDHPVYAFLEEHGLSIDDDGLYLRRSVGKDGRSKAYINDQPVSAGLLKSLGGLLLEIHGQFDTQGLLDPKTHRALLDEYAAVNLQETSSLWSAFQDAQQHYETLKVKCENASVEEEYLRAALEDLDTLAPKSGEESELSALKERLRSREVIVEALNLAYAALSDENDPVRTAWSALDRVADKMGAAGEGAITALDRASAEIEEALQCLQSLSSDMEQSEHNLETIDDRLFSLRTQARKHNCTVEDLPDIREKLAQDLNMIEDADETLEAAYTQVEKSMAAYKKVALKLREQRQKAAQKLDALIAKELPPLKMERARFETCLEPLNEEEWGQYGMDRVRFLVATNPGAAAGPLNKIASGGEMSRFMLALKVVMAEIGTAPSLIFDEVDAGIGGSTADAVGERLASLAQHRQVLVVTHSPQVAARAGHQWIVSKSGKDEVTSTVDLLPDRKCRAEEIARMLSGASVTTEAIAAAEKLLEASAT